MPPPKCATSVDSPGLGLKGTIQEYLLPSPSNSYEMTSSSDPKTSNDDDDDNEGGELDLTDIDDAEIGELHAARWLKHDDVSVVYFDQRLDAAPLTAG